MPGHPILEYIESIPDTDQRNKAEAVLDRFETDAAALAEPNDEAEELIDYLKSRGVKLGILTRNSRSAVRRALANFSRISEEHFDAIVTRDDDVVPKPSPEGVRLAASKVGVSPGQMLVVGDFRFDIEAGGAAGCLTVFLVNGEVPSTLKSGADYEIARLADLKSIVRMHLPLRTGKFPNDLLRPSLSRFSLEDPGVLIPPRVGEDIAAVDIRGEEVLVLKSDPITFATDAVDTYAVLVNANDISTSGATPRWFLATLLFPPNTTPAFISATMENLSGVCRKWGITLCGGHTEITDAVTRPVVSGMLAGTTPRNQLVDKRNMRPGDDVLITKGIAVEGTSIIAREFADRLLDLGMTESEIEGGKAYLDSISIITEARIAADSPHVSAMHDVTEGGVATALEELSAAGEHGIRVDLNRIPILPETRKIEALLHIDPLGLIGSGSLLICSRPAGTDSLLERITAAGIQVAKIGVVLSQNEGLIARIDGKPVAPPRFRVDEITRLFEE
jgi:HAD superfamily hydrolase (TIGR01509 family)